MRCAITASSVYETDAMNVFAHSYKIIYIKWWIPKPPRLGVPSSLNLLW